MITCRYSHAGRSARSPYISNYVYKNICKAAMTSPVWTLVKMYVRHVWQRTAQYNQIIVLCKLYPVWPPITWNQDRESRIPSGEAHMPSTFIRHWRKCWRRIANLDDIKINHFGVSRFWGKPANSCYIENIWRNNLFQSWLISENLCS